MNIQEEIKEQDLIKYALDARKKAYAPYSNFCVGAAIYTKDQKTFTGCNVENASYGATNCAERTAAFKAVSEGSKEFLMIAIAGGVSEEMDTVSDYAYPCGVCRQVLREFSNPKEMIVLVAKNEKEYKRYTLEELLPNSFGPESLVTI